MTTPQQPSVTDQVARELHANGVHTKCPPECWTRWDASGHDAHAVGYVPSPGYPPGGVAGPETYASGYVPSPGYLPDSVAAAPAKSRRRLLLTAAGVVAVLAALVIGGLALFGGGPSPQQMTIKFSLFDAEGDGGDCDTGGDGGYSDIRPGMPVTVKDETGKILASTELPATGEDAGGDMGCTWAMHVLVPNNAQQYGVEAGRRGTVTYSKQQLVAKHWIVETSIG